jgi:chemotaxis protein methyltransferase CheR
MTTVSDQDLLYFVAALKNHTQYDLTDYSDKSLKRRLQKVLSDHKIDLLTLITRIKKDEEFLNRVINDITVNTTELFRDPQIWHALRYRVLPQYKNRKNINIWHAGCSSGQEVYSMLILLNELGMFDSAKVLATDINPEMLEQAQKGNYKYRFNIGYLDNFDKVIRENPYNYDEYYDVPYEKYFEINKTKDYIQMLPFLTDKPFFRRHDLVVDGNMMFAKFDIILCRNVIIYFNYELQNRVFKLFYENLFPGGILVLGLHETIMGPFASKFEKKGLYYKKI